MCKFFVIILLGGCLLFFGGCATLQKAVPDTLKSVEQIKIDNTKIAMEVAQKEYIKLSALIPPDISPSSGSITEKDIEERHTYLSKREAYVKSLEAEFNVKIALLEKKEKNSGYFALGTKGFGIAAGIASAALVTASPANAAIVAGLAVFSSGMLAFEDKATEIGYSTVIAQGQNSILKDKVNAAYLGFENVSWEYLHAIAKTASNIDWAKDMKTLGAQIVKFEAAVRYTKFDIQLIVKENR